MIAKPGVAPLLKILSRDLRTVVEPALSDRGVAVTVQMMAALLDALAVRCAGEMQWMQAECAAVLASADEALSRHPDASELQAAVLRVRELAADDGIERYEAAGEALSCLAEVALRTGDAQAEAAVRRLLSLRLEHEVAMIGENFQPIGRS